MISRIYYKNKSLISNCVVLTSRRRLSKQDYRNIPAACLMLINGSLKFRYCMYDLYQLQFQSVASDTSYIFLVVQSMTRSCPWPQRWLSRRYVIRATVRGKLNGLLKNISMKRSISTRATPASASTVIIGTMGSWSPDPGGYMLFYSNIDVLYFCWRCKAFYHFETILGSQFFYCLLSYGVIFWPK